jgi:hypothetical protein
MWTSANMAKSGFVLFTGMKIIRAPSAVVEVEDAIARSGQYATQESSPIGKYCVPAAS